MTMEKLESHIGEVMMRKRYYPGAKVMKKENAGFIGQRLMIEIPVEISDNVDFCMLDCGDPECMEYANVYVLDDSGKRIGECYHVSECQMEELPE